MKNPLDGFTVDRSQIRYIGEGLQRPECILAERDGTLWSADARGGVVRIAPDGSQQVITQSHRQAFATATDDAKRFTEGTLPNGLAFARNGDLLVSNFGTDCLEVMKRTGETRVLYDRIDGQPIGKVNFVLRDSKDRVWITISTMIPNWMRAVSPKIIDGRIAVVDSKGIRVVADGFHFTNEIRFDAKEEWLYIVETCGRRISRMRAHADGSLPIPAASSTASHLMSTAISGAPTSCPIASSRSRPRASSASCSTIQSRRPARRFTMPSWPTGRRPKSCWPPAARSRRGWRASLSAART
jgi:gluconolactonase